MSEQPERPDHISQQDWDEAEIPELTDEDFAKAIPFKDAHPNLYASWKRGRGRPKSDEPKLPMNFRFASRLVKGIKNTGTGYNARVEKLLSEALAKGELDARPTEECLASDLKTSQTTRS